MKDETLWKTSWLTVWILSKLALVLNNLEQRDVS